MKIGDIFLDKKSNDLLIFSGAMCVNEFRKAAYYLKFETKYGAFLYLSLDSAKETLEVIGAL
jgi:hypothetical protein